ncbi:hypothetical protein ABB37_04109 [Leptomonas pyrrhocoris]|uniref:ACB domain-containing protein n=1 Tax=Leptomonas pyrrhocoris TaxID=157538 RepID=A0A0N0VFQ5_LEPPY|nr:hypothetical protein ABB37_04109 [Leptomonas pyrrhocoris]XP_015660294.1 hypothetical protein ABB37_04109 [Leptomonas pyrrhocoris]KPA81854.1 hypothetical protein ABB37_04109 [Leptomonas pyrrhocoris]KPA81855.1 hypothetical protein ABB37_04109 [Leptomonas pyrrhocoris]|eukprot:XP_015660293.1 hypothetical protein ABB37_04109 [Leptomonas pyrrhocoris]
MDLPFPEKYYEVAKYFDFYIGDVEQTPLLTDAQRLLFYALRQQAEHGPCNEPQPSLWHLTERHKHQAWKQLGRISTFEAMVFFVQQFERVLWALEHPGEDVSAADASMKVTVDWPTRLRELQASSSEKDEREEKGIRNGTAEQRSTEEANPALSSPPSPQSAPSLPVSLSAEEMQRWDGDIVAHAALTLDNIRFLATELMRTREALRQARETVLVEGCHVNGSRSEKLPVLLPPTSSPSLSSGQSHTASAVPPLKPVWTKNGAAMPLPIVPPPVRFSARSLTEAAVRPPLETYARKRVVQDPTPAPPPDTSTSWFTWY